MSRKKRSERSGLLERSPAPPPAGQIQVHDTERIEEAFRKIEEAFRKEENHWSLPSLLATARDYVDKTGDQALKVYAKAELPDKLGCYERVSADEPWKALSVADTPSAPWRSLPQSPFPQGGTFKGMHLPEIGKMTFQPDSDGGFATMVLDRVRTASFLLRDAEKNQNAEAVIAFNAAVEMVLAWAMWREEFGLADWIAPTLKQQPGWSKGGNAKAAAEAHRLESERLEWQKCADVIWGMRPKLTKAAVARLVVTHLKLARTADWVSRRIKKPGGC